MVFIFVGVLSLFILYEFIAYLGIVSIPLLHATIENSYLNVASLVAFKWSLLVAVIGLVYALAGYFTFRNEEKSVPKLGVAIFYFIFTVVLLV